MVCADCGHKVWREDGRCRPCSLAVGHSDPESMHLPAVRTRVMFTLEELTTPPSIRFTAGPPWYNIVNDSVISGVPDDYDPIQGLDVSWIQPANGFCRSCERYGCLMFKAEQQRILRSREYRRQRHRALSNNAPAFVMLDYVRDLA